MSHPPVSLEEEIYDHGVTTSSGDISTQHCDVYHPYQQQLGYHPYQQQLGYHPYQQQLEYHPYQQQQQLGYHPVSSHHNPSNSANINTQVTSGKMTAQGSTCDQEISNTNYFTKHLEGPSEGSLLVSVFPRGPG